MCFKVVILMYYEKCPAFFLDIQDETHSYNSPDEKWRECISGRGSTRSRVVRDPQVGAHISGLLLIFAPTTRHRNI